MRTFNLKVGKKGSREAVKVPLQVAENTADIVTLSKNNESVAVRCFNRGWKIENQERSGARDAFGAGKSQEDIATIVATYDPSKVAERAPRGPKAPPTIKLDPKKKTYSLADLQAALAAQGFTVQTGDEAPAGAVAAGATA